MGRIEFAPQLPNLWEKKRIEAAPPAKAPRVPNTHLQGLLLLRLKEKERDEAEEERGGRKRTLNSPRRRSLQRPAINSSLSLKEGRER